VRRSCAPAPSAPSSVPRVGLSPPCTPRANPAPRGGASPCREESVGLYTKAVAGTADPNRTYAVSGLSRGSSRGCRSSKFARRWCAGAPLRRPQRRARFPWAGRRPAAKHEHSAHRNADPNQPNVNRSVLGRSIPGRRSDIIQHHPTSSSIRQHPLTSSHRHAGPRISRPQRELFALRRVKDAACLISNASGQTPVGTLVPAALDDRTIAIHILTHGPADAAEIVPIRSAPVQPDHPGPGRRPRAVAVRFRHHRQKTLLRQRLASRCQRHPAPNPLQGPRPTPCEGSVETSGSPASWQPKPPRRTLNAIPSQGCRRMANQPCERTRSIYHPSFPPWPRALCRLPPGAPLARDAVPCEGSAETTGSPASWQLKPPRPTLNALPSQGCRRTANEPCERTRSIYRPPCPPWPRAL